MTHKFLLKALIVIFYFGSICPVFSQSNTVTKPALNPHLFYVTGEGSAQVLPDYTVIVFETEVNMKNLDWGALQNNLVFQDIEIEFQKLKSANTGDISYESFPLVDFKGDSVIFKKQFYITVKKIAKLHAVLWQMHNAGLKNIKTIYYRSSALSSVSQQAKNNALENARTFAISLRSNCRKVAYVSEDICSVSDVVNKHENQNSSDMLKGLYLKNPGYITIYYKLTVGFENETDKQ